MDRRYVVACWFPSLLAGIAVVNAAFLHNGWDRSWRWWSMLETAEQAWLAVALLAAVSTTAFLVQVLPVLRLFEGYLLPAPLARLGRWIQHRSRKRLRRLAFGEVSSPPAEARRERRIWRWIQRRRRPDEPKRRSAERAYLLRFPGDPTLVQPTKLGNILVAAEEHALKHYGIDAVVWWPRLMPLLPQIFRQQADEALLPLLAFVNLAALFAVATGVVELILLATRAWVAAMVALPAGAALAWATSMAAAAQAPQYGSCIRSAFDLYRNDLLRALHVELPNDLPSEQRLWRTLTQWIYRMELPSAAHVSQAIDQQAPPWSLAFRYVHSQVPPPEVPGPSTAEAAQCAPDDHNRAG